MFLMCSCFYGSVFTSTSQYIQVGDEITAGLRLPAAVKQIIGIYLHESRFSVADNKHQTFPFNQGQISTLALKPGQLNMEVKLFGFIPLRRMTVNVVAPKTVLPGGQSIGVLLHSEGVMVVGEAPVETKSGKRNPAKDAGIAVGDLILKANDIRLTSERQLQQAVDKQGRQGKTINLLVKHGNQTKSVLVQPVLCRETNLYRIGLFIKDSTAGVGTLTFYDPTTKNYGALGHIIHNYAQDGHLDLYQGKIVEAAVKGLHPGKKGEPGEKLGVFKGESDIIGTIDKNTNFGIFGKLDKALVSNPYYRDPVPVALSYQVKPGPAEILTVLDENIIEKFTVQIDQITPGSHNKGLIIKITDRELIRRTGGIIQGMSGSPIMQDGRLVGAVTHVFINDPTKGYGVLAENMLQEINLLNTVTLPISENNEKIAG